MKAIRQILSDRVLTTALAVVLAYLLAFQGFTGNLARASTVIAAQDPLHMLCGPSGVVSPDPPGTDAPLKRGADCPCASLCRLASSVVPILDAPTVVLSPSLAMTPKSIFFPVFATPAPARRDLLPDARGPPAIS